MKKKLFSLFLKKLSNGTEIYYYTTYDETGKRRQFSTGKQSIDEAYKECYKRLSEDKILVKSNLIFSTYTEDWFKHDICPYHSIRIQKGKTYSRSSLDNKKGILTKHILPTFSNLRMNHITTTQIEKWLQDKKNNGYAVNSINIHLSVLNIIFNEAKRSGIIDRNPCDNVIRFSEGKSSKGILTNDEINSLFDINKIQTIWKSDTTHYLLNKTASITGMRIGEILCLTKDKIFDGYIEVSNSYDRKYGIKSTKSGATRYVPIPKELSIKLRELSLTSKGQFIFSGKDPKKPLSHATVLKRYYIALENIGITQSERKNRNLTFHSYRHLANTRLREAGVNDAIVREIIGHKSTQMTERYSHIDTRNIIFDSLKII